MTILVTGASGFIGSALVPRLLAKGHRVYALSRHPPESVDRLAALVGDITEPDLALDSVPCDITVVYHLAGAHTLRQEDKDNLIWQTNVLGTRNVLEFCLRHDIPRLVFISTAYTWPVNPYGISKIKNEEDIAIFAGKHRLKVTILKPSIVVGTDEHPNPGHFSKFVSAVVHIHKRADLVRRKIEGSLRLPILEPVFRIKGDPEGRLNLVSIEAVVQGMADINEEGTFWLTNPDPPALSQLAEWVGEFVMLRIKFLPEFKSMPIEAAFQKMTAPFQPYLQGDHFPSDIKDCPPITREFIHDTIKRTINP